MNRNSREAQVIGRYLGVMLALIVAAVAFFHWYAVSHRSTQSFRAPGGQPLLRAPLTSAQPAIRAFDPNAFDEGILAPSCREQQPPCFPPAPAPKATGAAPAAE